MRFGIKCRPLHIIDISEQFGAKWNTIKVPSNWEMEGWGDPMFRNVPVPFKANPPYVPHEYNPSGAYRTTFTIPSNWNGEEVFLRFEKVASASFLWINGQEVGYNEGAQEPSEYNITKYVKAGKNTLSVLVLKYSDGYYLEGQDYWRLAGIFDDVTLYSTPDSRIWDYQVTTDFDSSFIITDLLPVYPDERGGRDLLKADENLISIPRGRQSEGCPICSCRIDVHRYFGRGHRIRQRSGCLP